MGAGCRMRSMESAVRLCPIFLFPSGIAVVQRKRSVYLLYGIICLEWSMLGKLIFTYLDKDVKREKDSSPTFSEFCFGGYDVPSIIKLYQTALKNNDVDGAVCLSGVGDDELNAWIKKNLEILDEFEGSSAYRVLGSLASLDSTGEQSQINVSDLVKKFTACADMLQDRIKKEGAFYIEDLGEQYLSAFYHISSDAVFSEYNANLFNASFRKSEFLSGVPSFAAVKRGEDKSNTYYEFSFLNPFAYDTIKKTVQGMDLLSQTNKKGSELLSELRESIFWDSAQSALKRYVYLDGKSHRLNLNRHDSSLAAFSVDKLSSTEEIKPIRLFEKTASFIRNGLRELQDGTEKIEVKVCVIGHTEMSHCEDECSLMDYVASVLNWYNKLSSGLDGRKKSKLDFHVKNIVSNGDWPPFNQTHKRRDFDCTLGDHIARCVIEKVDYENTFGFNTQRLEQEIRENNLLFLLDCPWLSTENFEIKQRGSLDMFCRELSRYSRDDEADPDEVGDQFVENAHNFYKNSVFRVIDSQYNRIMASTTTKSGEVTRVMRDYLFRRINKAVDAAQKNEEGSDGGLKRKALYVFTSESDGIEHSYLAFYPLTRQEKYDGRAHTIIRFSNVAPELLQYRENTKIEFQISLWSVLKYISVSYAYLDFKNRIKACLGIGQQEEPEDAISYFELYRNIIVSFEVSDDLRKITAWVGFMDGINDCINEFPCQGGDEARETIKKELHQKVLEFLRPLYTEAVFSSNRHYGDDAIKMAFSMNLYSAVNDVHTMLFWHKYRMAYQKDRFDAFHIEFSDSYCSEPVKFRDKEFCHRDFFMDKKLYDSVMLSLEQNPGMPLGLQRILYYANDLYEGNMIDQVLSNIVRACESTKYMDTDLHKNTKQIVLGG